MWSIIIIYNFRYPLNTDRNRDRKFILERRFINQNNDFADRLHLWVEYGNSEAL